MKRLLIALVMLTSLTTMAAPWNLTKPKTVDKETWTNPFKASKAFTDPYVTNASAYELSPNYQPNHTLQIQVTFDQSVPVPYYAVISVYGVWDSQPGGASEKYFTVLFPTGWSYKVFNFPMSSHETAYTESTYTVDYGPQ